MSLTREEAISQLCKSGWSEESINIWIRAGGRCEYCGRDLLACEDAHFHGQHLDHIVPDGGDGFENRALACAACNRIKRAERFERQGVSLSRQERIAAAAKYIALVRQNNRERLARSLDWLRICGLVRETK